MIEMWKKDMKYIHIQQNFYIDPRFKIINVKKVSKSEFPGCNSSGFWGTEKNGIMNWWIDFKIYKNYDGNWSNLNDTIHSSFVFSKNKWLKNYRKIKLKKLNRI